MLNITRLACGLLLGVCAWAQNNATPPMLGRLVDAGGYRVHLFCIGQGTPTVMVVGGGLSFDWGLVQPEVAKFTRVCTFDPSGTAWSDAYSYGVKHDGVTPNCADRVGEIHRMLENAGERGAYVLVGFSIGGLLARLYASNYSADVAGLVIVDHAFINVGPGDAPQHTTAGKETSGDSAPVLISAPPMEFGIEDDENFRKLPQRNRDLHAWAKSIGSWRPSADDAKECFAAIDNATKGEKFPLGNKPELVIRTSNEIPGYDALQEKLLRLSRNSREMTAGDSTHMVIVDAPEITVRGIGQVVEAVRSGGTLR